MLPSRVPVYFVYRRSKTQVFICNWIFSLERCCQMPKKVSFFVTEVDVLLNFGRKAVRQTGSLCRFQYYVNECISCNSLVHRLIPCFGRQIWVFKGMTMKMARLWDVTPYIYIYIYIYVCVCVCVCVCVYGPGSSVGIARMITGWTVRDPIPVGTRFSARPDRPWGPPLLL